MILEQDNDGLGNQLPLSFEDRERDEWRRVHEAVEYAEVRERNKVRIKTKINKRDVYVRDYYPS